MPSVGTKLEGLLMDEFEEDFNPRAYETAANGLANHQSNNNPLLNGQISAGTNFFLQSNGTTSPPPLCKRTRTVPRKVITLLHVMTDDVFSSSL